MDYSQTYAISAAGMNVERLRVDVAASNLANANAAITANGVNYQPLQVVATATGAHTFGALVGFDLAKLWDVPISTSLAYRVRTGSGKSGNISGGYRSAQLGLFYNALSSVMIGGDLFYSTIRVSGGTIPDLDAIQFRLVTHIDF